jgi:hypothetical protein
VLGSILVSAKAIVDLDPGWLRDQLVERLTSIGVEALPGDQLSEEALALFRAAGAQRPAVDKPTEVHLWAGRRLERELNPFERGDVHHIVGAGRDLNANSIASLLEHLRARDWIRFDKLLAKGARREIYSVMRSDEKASLMVACARFLDTAGALPFCRDGMLLVLDELFTNAVYNAPMLRGVRVNTETSRTVLAESPRPVTVTFGADDETVGISVRDEYGSLAADTVLSSLRRCHGVAQPAPEEKKGGAGLGFYFMLQNASHMVINIHPGQFTEMIVTRGLRERRREFMNSTPSLNLCIKDRVGSTERRWDRWPVKWPALYGADGVVQNGTVLDISAGGCFIRPELKSTAPAEGTDLEITFSAESGKLPMVVRGVVRWRGFSKTHECQGFGVEFARKP